MIVGLCQINSLSRKGLIEVRDDVTPTQQPSMPLQPSVSRGQKVLESLSRVQWSNLLSGKWWWRWFRRSMMQSGRLTTLLSLIMLVGVRIEDPEFLQRLRLQAFDLYQVLRPRPFIPDSPVVIVDIDERSVAEQGQWPWSRLTIGSLVDRLTEMEAKVIGFDVLFAEADRTSLGIAVDEVGAVDDETRAKLKSLPTNDEFFAERLKVSGRVVLGQNFAVDATVVPKDRIQSSFSVVGADPAQFVENHKRVIRPISILESAAAGRGVISLSQNRIDGIVREVPMVMKIRSSGEMPAGMNPSLLATQGLLPSLTLEMLRVSLNARTIGIKTDPILGVEEMSIRPARSRERYFVPTDKNSQVWVYFTPHSQLANTMYVSATDVVNGRIDPSRIKDKFVLVGTSASGLFDLRATPLDDTLPGVEVHANILENILFDQRLKRTTEFETLEVFVAVIGGFVMIILTPAVGARVGMVIFLLLAGSYVGYSLNAFVTRLELYSVVFPVVVMLLFYVFLTYAAFSSTEAQKKQVRSAFAQYLSSDLVERLADDPSRLQLGGENRDMTFMFSDVRGFTSISELFDAQGLTRLINRLLTPLTNIIMAHHGTIDKYMGDCVMAFWNAPLDVPDHPREACRSALEMMEALKEVNRSLKEEAESEGREHREIAIGIGLNTGIACVGNMGSDQRFDYSVLGDNVNLASRLEGQSKTYGVTCIIGEQTAAEAPEFAVLELDLIRVKGKHQAVRIFVLAGNEQVANSVEFKTLKAEHELFLAAFRRQDWITARKHRLKCGEFLAKSERMVGLTTKLYDVYAERIAEYMEAPPGPDWDGVYVATSK